MGKHGHRIATDEEVQATVREWEAEGFDPPPPGLPAGGCGAAARSRDLWPLDVLAKRRNASSDGVVYPMRPMKTRIRNGSVLCRELKDGWRW